MSLISIYLLRVLVYEVITITPAIKPGLTT